MTKEDFKTKLYNTVSEGIKNHIKAFDFKETSDDENDFILGTIVYSNSHLAISTSRWDASTFALDSITLEIFNFDTEWDKAFEFFWEKILMVPGWDNQDYEEQLILEKEEYTRDGYFAVKGKRYC